MGRIKKTIKQKQVSFGTKAETLQRLSSLVRKSIIGKIVKFTVKKWRTEKDKIIDKVYKEFGYNSLIVRSSAFSEDLNTSSSAGRFQSILDVSLKNKKEFVKAVNTVIASYRERNTDNQVFIQKLVRDVEISGVVFTRDRDTLAPYMIFNYDDTSGRTDLVTSGKIGSFKTLVVFRKKRPDIKDKRIKKIYQSILEIERLLVNDGLDIEFCYKDQKVYTFQVRPLVKNKGVSLPDKKAISNTLDYIYKKIKELNLPHPDLYGKQNLYGIMPDWNPAELIGVKPRPLALSLFRELITDNIWAFQRDNYGYKRLRSFPLMISFANHPYIDVRVDFNSFIPKTLSNRLSHKLADFYIDKLMRSPASHDKVEFDIVYSCYSFDLDIRMKELIDFGFTKKELIIIKRTLLDLTNDIINTNGRYKEDLKKVKILERRRKNLLASNLSAINKIYWLIEDCKRYGTLPFAGIARAAFIAVQFLNSLVDLGIIDLKEKNLFINSLNTIAKQLGRDINRLAGKKIKVSDFLKKYGHLRPGTFDILSESYEESPHKYFDFKNLKPVKSRPEKRFNLFKSKQQQLSQLLKEHKLQTNTDDFITFLKEVIEGREYAKFLFTKNINEVFKLIRKYGRRFGFSTEDMSYVSIAALLKFNSRSSFMTEKKILKDEIKRNKDAYSLYRCLKLPYLIRSPSDIYSFYLDDVKPNYITLNKITGKPALIDYKRNFSTMIKNKIIFIESADPGFDWIFSHKIAGLVTMYGGVNSHMAIRSSELNIPAVIGCGSVNFDLWKKAKKLEIDCLNEQVKILS